jgi:type III pantothenate kinase
MMFLAIDIGNTETTIGAFERGTLKGSFRLSSEPAVTPDELGIAVLDLFRIYFGQKAKVEKAAIASVVPALTKTNIDMVKSYFGVSAEILTHKAKIDFKLGYDDPSQLGADRLANIIATRRLYGYPAIMVDIGTATKYDILDESGDYIGGIIAPGPASSAKNLFEAGARLFPVGLEKPERLLGTNSVQCLKSGIYNGFLGQLQYLIKRIKDELKYREIKLIVTGGYAEIFSTELNPLPKVDAGLTLKGIKIAFDR